MNHSNNPPVTSQELAHFGVMGMKWGVRNNRTEATTMGKGDRKLARKNVNDKSWQVFEEKHFNTPSEITKQKYNSLSTKDVTIRKGTEVRRVTQRRDEVLREFTYVSHKPEDRDIYRVAMTMQMRAGAKTYKKSYENTYKAVNTLKSPSEKARVDAFIELFDTPSVTMRNGKTITGRQYLERIPAYKKQAKRLDSQQLGLAIYRDFVGTQYLGKHPLNKAYYNNIASKGYNAIVDDNDRGHLAKEPLIILNPNGTLKKMKVHELTADEINKAQLDLKPHLNGKS
jgi:hypothetical protein